MLQNQKYNGWKNYETWNVMLWINGTYNLSKALEEIREEYKLQYKKLSYKQFINEVRLQDETTGDGVKFINNNLSYIELNEAIQGMA